MDWLLVPRNKCRHACQHATHQSTSGTTRKFTADVSDWKRQLNAIGRPPLVNPRIHSNAMTHCGLRSVVMKSRIRQQETITWINTFNNQP